MDTTELFRAARALHDATDTMQRQLASAGAVQARGLLHIMAIARTAADELEQFAGDVLEDSRAAGA